MGRAGLRGLEFYDPANKKHGQAHMQARYEFSFIFGVMLIDDHVHIYIDLVSPSSWSRLVLHASNR